MSDETTNPLQNEIGKAISENDVILFMKGTPTQPMCGFSARTVAMLQSLGRPFAAVDVLPDPRIRQELSAFSNWPTIPQLFVDGELVGGCDIVTEMYESGELQQVLEAVGPGPGQGQPPSPGLLASSQCRKVSSAYPESAQVDKALRRHPIDPTPRLFVASLQALRHGYRQSREG